MHYYQFHIGDYRSSTMHLSNEEDLAYRRLIDWYYDTESPIPLETKWVSRRLRVGCDALESVLNDFFVRTEDGWVSPRCEQEIAAYYKAKKEHWGNKLTKAERCHIQAQRNASKLNATPAWLSKSQLEEIAAIYAEAALKTAETGIKHEVDHIIPLRGKTVRGLHVPWNLRVIEAYKNRIKSNALEEN